MGVGRSSWAVVPGGGAALEAGASGIVAALAGGFGPGVVLAFGGSQAIAQPALLAGCACALVWRLRSGSRRSSVKTGVPTLTRGSQAVAGAGAVLALMALAAWGRPADSPVPAPTTVFLAPGPADAPDKTFVLASPQLLERLHSLTRPAGAPGAVLLKADYAGKIVEGAAEFDAAFQAYCFSDETTALTFPLDGVQLTGDVLLDGPSVPGGRVARAQGRFHYSDCGPYQSRRTAAQSGTSFSYACYQHGRGAERPVHGPALGAKPSAPPSAQGIGVYSSAS